MKLVDSLPAALKLSESINLVAIDSATKIVRSVASIELLIGVSLFFRQTRIQAAGMALVLASAFAVWATHDAVSGRSAGCGCFGNFVGAESFAMRIATIVVLIACCGFLYASKSTRRITGAPD